MSSVLELMHYSAPYAGNFIPSIVSLSDALAQQGVQMIPVFSAAARSCEWVPMLRERELPVYFLPDRLPQAARMLRRIIREQDVICVHSHFIDHTFYLPLRAACAGRAVAHVFHAHSMPRFSLRGSGIRRALLHADKTVCVSDAVRRAYEARGFTNCVTVPNGVDLDRLENGDPPQVSHPLVLMFGYDFLIKGIDTALDALDACDPAHRYTLGICVAGHGDEARQMLCARYGEMPDWIRLFGPRTDVGAYYRMADVFLSASRTEGMPYAVLEAAYCGLPLVLSDIEQHRTLRLPQAQKFPTEDAQALFAALERAVQSSPAPENRSFVAAQYSLGHWTRRVCLELISDKE